MPRFSPDFLDELKARLRPSDVIGRYMKLKRQGNEWAGLSPFTKEKTPSFFVNDQKGFYHCFSSGKHGDAISFLQETQKLSFVEAVTRLAEEAGMEIPEDNPQEAAAAEKRQGLAEACEAAAQFFQATLGRAQGRAAADYLVGRGVTREQIDAFNIGYAPGERTALKDYLINKEFTEETLVEAGLLIKPEDGGASYDRFRNRIMFPILGPRDRVIAFGGRALDPNARAKYLNSPETPLFHKSNVLYNLAAARKAASEDKKALIICEGYMDVIALWGAGLGRAVAPLGTALTENQLALLWRASDEPVMCFDGDKAGLAAAYRSIDRALPLLKPGKSLAFVFLPDGQDPDDFVREKGAGAFDKLLAQARPLVDVLWRRELESKSLDTPERRAAFRAGLRALVKTITDKDVRDAYGGELAVRLDERFAPPARSSQRTGGRGGYPGRSGFPSKNGPFGAKRRGGSGGDRGGFWGAPAASSTDILRRSASSAFNREATLLLAAIIHPGLVERREEAFLALDLSVPGLNRLLAEILAAISARPTLDSEGLKAHLTNTQAAEVLERVLGDETLNRQKFLRTGAEMSEVEQGWSSALHHYLFATIAQQELRDAAPQSLTDEEEIWKAAVTARDVSFNSTRSGDGRSGGGEKPKESVTERLERMRPNVDARRKK